MKTVLFVPGFQENSTSRDYAKTIKIIEDCGYKVEFIQVQWLRTTIENWKNEFNKIYESYNPEDVILAGFSFGAVTVFMSAIERSPSGLWLFSLSPYFGEDMKSDSFNQSWLAHLGHRRVEAFKKLNFTSLVKRISSKTIFFYGDLELKKWPDIEYRNKAIAQLPNTSVVIAVGAKHDVSSDAYVAAIKKAIQP